MKKRILAVLLGLTMTFSMVGCGTNDGDTTNEENTQKGAPEQSVVRWNYGTSGNVLITIANEKGYFEEEGITIKPVAADENNDAMSLLQTGKVDVVSNAGTSTPLQQIAAGMDFTLFGGHMVNGCMPIVAKEGAEWNGVESLVGKKFACNTSYFALTGAVMDAVGGDPFEAVEWVTYNSYNDALAAVIRGEVDYALMGTGQNYAVKEELADKVDIVAYQSEIMPNYSCCRMLAQTEWVDKNPNTVKAIIRALLRAQSYYEANKEEAVSMHAEAIDATEDYVAAYMLDDEHYTVSVDPLQNSVVRAWGILGETGLLDGNDADILDHINTSLYEEALAEAAEKYGEEAPKFYENMKTFFGENNK